MVARGGMRRYIILAVVLLLAADRAEAKRLPGHPPKMRTWFSYGVRGTSPQTAAVSAMAMRALEPDEGWVTGWFVQGEPGVTGGKLSAGYGVLEPSDRWFLPAEFGVGLKASVLRTWRTSGDLPAGITFVGGEVDLTVFYGKLSAGWLRQVAGPPRPEKGLFTWGIGVGF
jgi:hypothetical protein